MSSKSWSSWKLEHTPQDSAGVRFEPSQFQRFRPIHVCEAVRSGVAQEFVPRALQGESWDGVGGPAAEIAGEREGLRGRGFRQSHGSRSRALGPWDMGE